MLLLLPTIVHCASMQCPAPNIHNADDSSDRAITYLFDHRTYFLKFTMRHNITVFTGVTLPHCFNGITSNVENVQRLQRAVRCFLGRRRVLALMMGLHPRLGAGICMVGVPADVVRLMLSISETECWDAG